jgi:large subunit ribosomal protein L17
MRHSVKGRKLGRTASHRSALLNALTTSLLKHKRIRTTEAKAKEARTFIEKLITKAKKNDLHVRRQVVALINDKDVVKELFSEIIPKIGERPGGYTRVVKLGNRNGDAAPMAILE